MRYSSILFSTRKESVSNVDVFSQELLVRAGYVQQLSAGIFTAMHFGLRSLRKIERILREEMERIGGVEISMPVVHPAEIWKQTGRYDELDESLVRFTDRAGRDMVLAMTHEEVVAAIARSEIRTYRQLPKLVYQIQTKFRDEARARGGLIRVREFAMKDSYSLDADWEGLEKQYEAHYQAYHRIFARAGLPVIAVQSDVGMMGGRIAHEFMYLTDIGEDTIFICENTGYRANKEIARFKKPIPPVEAPLPPEKVYTPGTKTIEEVANFLGITPGRCGKIVFFSGMIAGEEKVIVAVVRGDMEVNKVKLQNLIKSEYLNPATEAEIAAIGSVPGYASPVGLDRRKTLVVADDLIPASMNLVLGANEADHHMKNLCYGRDYQADLAGDIVNAFEGAPAPDARSEADVLKAVRGIEVGNIFQLGTQYTDAQEATYTDPEGKPRSIVMGSFGIGLGRLLGCLAEEHHDERGLTLPVAIAPYEVLIVCLPDSQEVIERAEQLYTALSATGLEVLYDDRPKKMASPGERFNDADLIGIPVRLTVSERSLRNGGVEMKRRRGGEVVVVGFEEVLGKVRP
ncbi:MAG: proline--tRNA ligase [Saprospiraceae bacterium]